MGKLGRGQDGRRGLSRTSRACRRAALGNVTTVTAWESKTETGARKIVITTEMAVVQSQATLSVHIFRVELHYSLCNSPEESSYVLFPSFYILGSA